MSETDTVTPDEDTKGRVGRPRSQDTLTRDAVVMDALNTHDGLTKAEISEATGLSPNAVYLSLWRLGRNEQVEKSAVAGRGAHVWHVTGRIPAPVAQEAEAVSDEG